MSYQTISFTKEGGIGFITLNRPDKLNAINEEMTKELIEVSEELKKEKEVKVVILTGKGRAFCAGADLNSAIFDIVDPIEVRESIMNFGRFVFNLRGLPKPTIAGVNGVAIGAGLSLALACDIIIASEKARFGYGFTSIGSPGDTGITYLLPLVVGPAKALEIAFTGRIIDATEAERISMVNKVVPPERLHTEVKGMAWSIVKMPPLAIGLVKRSIYEVYRTDLLSAMEWEARATTLCLLGENKKEGVKDFREKK